MKRIPCRARSVQVAGVILAVQLFVSPAVAGPEIARAKPEEVGLSSERLQRLSTWADRLQAEGKISGAVTLVARKGKIARFEAQGVSNLESKRPMRDDDIFAIASMTKPIATVGVLMLLEEQRLLLGDPLEKFLPEFRGMKVAVPKAEDANGYVLVPTERSITIHDLLTQRSGLATGVGPAGGLLRDAMSGLPTDAVLADRMRALAKVPLVFQPGSAWLYGPSTDVLGRVIEVVSGQTLDVFLRERIFAPLGMVDTAFVVPPEKRSRLALIYNATDTTPLAPGQQRPLESRFYSAGGGLFSTAADYLRFCQMLLNGGELDGRRLLGRKSIELMTARHVETIPLPFLPGQSFGLGVAVQKENGSSGLLGSPGTYGWSGAYNSYFRIDPKEELILILMVQRTPGNNLELHYGFQNLVMQAIVD
jgi:CubicO group peptidase (beta-lactamase class C family)